MKPAVRDTVDVGDTSGVLILRNLLKGKNGPENPAYRLIRHCFMAPNFVPANLDAVA